MTSRAKILMAEDNAPFAKAKAVGLKPAGFDVTVAHDGFEAWDYAQRGQFDVLLTDYDMPGIKGADLCRRLRCDVRYARTPIILMTCFVRDLDVARLMDELQLAAVLEKPFQTPELLKTIEQCLVGVRENLTGEDFQLAEIVSNVDALQGAVHSAIFRVSHGQQVEVVRGPLEGLQGIVVGLRAAGRVLMQLSEGGFVELPQDCLRAVS
jgi:CheY-like chemotaxis protein